MMEGPVPDEEELYMSLIIRTYSYQFYETTQFPPQPIKNKAYIKCALHTTEPSKTDLWNTEKK